MLVELSRTIYATHFSSSRSHLPPPRRSPSPLRHYSPPPSSRHSPVHNVSPRRYSPPTRHYSQRSPSPVRRSIRRRSPSPPNATLGTIRGRNMPNVPSVRIIQMQELHRIVQDTDMGISAIVPVMQVSSSQMGLDLSALMQPAIPEGRSQISRSIEGAHDSGSMHYRSRPHSRSPPRERRSRQRSPSPIPLCRPSLVRRRSLSPVRRRSPSPPRHRPFVPRRPSPLARRSNYGPSRQQPQTSAQRPSPPRQGHSWLPDPWLSSGNVHEAEPMELDPQHSWGETFTYLTPDHPSSENMMIPANTATLSTSLPPPASKILSSNNPKMAGPSKTPSEAR